MRLEVQGDRGRGVEDRNRVEKVYQMSLRFKNSTVQKAFPT